MPQQPNSTRHSPPHHQPQLQPQSHSYAEQHSSPLRDTGTSGAQLDQGCNSDDEASAPTTKHMEEDKYEVLLKKKRGFLIKRMAADGNCLFRSIADQVYGDQELHMYVREQCMNYMEKERDHFSQYITEDFATYVKRKRKSRVYGNNVEMQAFAELYNRPIEIFSYSFEPINIFHSTYSTDNSPIRLSYHHHNHYNSVIDPNNPAVGVGLGLPGYDPAAEDKKLMKTVIQASEDDQIEDILVKNVIDTSELAIAEHDIEQAILTASRAEFLADLCKNIFVPPTQPSHTPESSHLQQQRFSPSSRSNEPNFNGA